MNIRDYLHLYIGAKHRYKFIDSEGFSVWLDLLPHRLPRLEDASISEIQLALRPLSSMTEEEAIEFITTGTSVYKTIMDIVIKDDCLSFEGGYGHTGRTWVKVIAFNSLKPQQFKFLLSKHFDVFGLIKAGIAIDAAKIKVA